MATIVLSALLVALMLPLIGSGLEGSRAALLRMPATYNLRSGMDAWWQLHRSPCLDDLPGLSTPITEAAAADPPPSYSVLYNEWWISTVP